MTRLVQIVLVTFVAACLAALAVFAYTVVSLSSGSSADIAAGSRLGAYGIVVTFTCVFALGLVAALFYGLIRLAKRAWQD